MNDDHNTNDHEHHDHAVDGSHGDHGADNNGHSEEEYVCTAEGCTYKTNSQEDLMHHAKEAHGRDTDGSEGGDVGGQGAAA